MVRRAVVVMFTLSMVMACSGARPSAGRVADPPLGGNVGEPTGIAPVDAVLRRLESAGDATFTATYSITRKLGALKATATVAKRADTSAVTIGTVRYLVGTTPRTCDLTAKRCEDTINDARTSDLGIGSAFWRDNPGRALRVTSARRAGAPTGTPATAIGGQDATCVDVPVGQGTEHYCALAAGAIARWDTAYVDVELTSFTPSVDDAAFATPT